MRMPGFTAEAAVYRSRGHYRAGLSRGGRARAEALVPSARSGRDPWPAVDPACVPECRVSCSSLCLGAPFGRKCHDCLKDCYATCPDLTL
ncbi:hypothetical protein CFP65_0923 [Kitasatospora sp. MMS16-BH015]|nr:hypothetical protein CFP65_0923 [Kitasatospora sp. MMS16-BH015]